MMTRMMFLLAAKTNVVFTNLLEFYKACLDRCQQSVDSFHSRELTQALIPSLTEPPNSILAVSRT